MESFGQTQTTPLITYYRVPDRKPPDKTSENAGPVDAGTGVEWKSHWQRLHLHIVSNNWLNQQANCRKAGAFGGGAKPRRKAKNRERFRAVDADSNRQKFPHLEDNNWQSIGSIIDRLLVEVGGV